MTDLLSITTPIFLLIALGFVSTRTGVVKADFIQGLGFFVLNFALPALILKALLGQDLRETFNASYVAAYAGGSLGVFLIVLITFRYWLRRPLSLAAMASLGAASSNSGFVGFPIAALAIGMPALAALPLTMLVENALVIPLALVLAEAGKAGGNTSTLVMRKTLSHLMRTPVFLSILLGLALSTLGVRPPASIATVVTMIADASVACALFVVGGTLAGVGAASVSDDLAWIVTAKLVLHPLSVAAGFVLLGGVPAELMAAGIILASAPMLTVYPILGQRFGLAPLCAAALVAATAASFVTMTGAIALVGTGERLTVPQAQRQTGLPEDNEWRSRNSRPEPDTPLAMDFLKGPEGMEDQDEEPCFDVAHLGHVELLTGRPDESLGFFVNGLWTDRERPQRAIGRSARRDPAGGISFPPSRICEKNFPASLIGCDPGTSFRQQPRGYFGATIQITG